MTQSQSPQVQKDRNKLNQRAFRARRQQRVQDLEAKLRQYEAAQLRATQQMQQAARVVAAENAMLRDVLRMRLGLGEAEIEALRREWIGTRTRTGTGSGSMGGLDSGLDGNDADRGDVNSDTASWSQHQQPQPQQQHELRNTSGKTAHTTASVPNVDVDRRLGVMDPAHILHLQSSSPPSSESYDPKAQAGRSACCSPGAASTNMCSIKPTSTEPRSSSSAFMSCEKAAEILSSIRTQDELYDVRARLGCTSPSTCMIENTIVMDVMNESI